MWLVAATVTAYSTAGAASAPNIPTDSWRLADKALRLLLLKLLVLLRSFCATTTPGRGTLSRAAVAVAVG